MKIGVTLLFKEKNTKKIKGILKSFTLDIESKDKLNSKILSISKEIENYYDYEYIGINDLFSVTGNPVEGELLGRSTLYDLDSIDKAMTLLKKDKFSFNNSEKSKVYNCSLIYYCELDNDENCTITVLTIVNAKGENVISRIKSLAKESGFLNKIESNSVEKINKLSYIGIESICEIDLKFNVFQSFYSDFDNLKTLKNEVLSKNEINEILIDLVNIPN